MVPRLGIFSPSVEKNKGFTLLELMVVIALIGALSAIGIPAYQGYVSDAREKEAKNTLQTIALQQKSFYSENFRYFTTLEDVDQSFIINTGLFSSTSGSGPLQTTERLYNFWIINTGADPLLARTFRAVAQERQNTNTFFSIDQEMSKTSTINGTAGGSW